MKTLINNVVLYNSSDGTLRRIDAPSDDESISLTPTANRLLELLIKHQGSPIEKDILLTEAWDKFGLKGSYSSLNQYISQLRKVLLLQMENNEIIITIPKVGFMLSDSVVIEKIQTGNQKKSEHFKEAIPHTHENNWPHRLKIATTIMAALLSISGSYQFFSKQSVKKHYYVGTIDHCTVYNFQPISSQIKDFLLQLAENKIAKTNTQCESDEVLFISAQNSLYYGHSGRLFLAKCLKDEDKIIACKNYYHYIWDNK
ncbi:winged helix family transcriptional regulator [Vibrio cincinnatiensis]|jgi:DNA-binding winged helix-turn-helix (wHTH) protein|nr:winged helix-turn-helix domain-containing protein [Vibrio cincinnatiensis]MCG3723818.1 winged helix family transcriptional regulator [Vibrio cincinnatiensis]MCG3726145.1 winged helix family transcriptional regulator [Vibrio cincinnatiensis]MCG3736622.1 winged helix family transcriptional regulator [Vibrio cincinnatiensis]MCG3747094.1 winged helix family transcriptional regulator [Vibrio cincinnatiensis]MCG3765100.1 winged helix family transcriptional regulator [Vibrio cincinnatiensis]